MKDETKKEKLIIEISDIDCVHNKTVRDLLIFLSDRGNEIYTLDEDDFWALIACFIHAHYGVNASHKHQDEMSAPLAASIRAFGDYCDALIHGEIDIKEIIEFKEEGDPDDE